MHARSRGTTGSSRSPGRAWKTPTSSDGARPARTCVRRRQRIDGTGRRGLDQIANRRQGIEEKVGVELGAKRPQLGFGREALHPLLRARSVRAARARPKRVDAPRALLRDGLEEAGHRRRAGGRPAVSGPRAIARCRLSTVCNRSSTTEPEPAASSELRAGRDDPTIGEKEEDRPRADVDPTRDAVSAIDAENDRRPQSRPRPGRRQAAEAGRRSRGGAARRDQPAGPPAGAGAETPRRSSST